MRYLLISHAGDVLREQAFDAPPPPIATNKGRWLPEVMRAYNPATHTLRRVDPVPGNAVAVTYQAVPRTVSTVLAERFALLADERYRHQVAGVVVGGQRIQTDPESRATLLGALVAMQQGFVSATDWKTADGWASVTLAEVEAMARAVVAHVDACFARERALHDQLAALAPDVAAIAAVDLTQGWPA